MPRSISFEVPLDAGVFGPTQMQPVAAGRLAFQAGGRWLRAHVCSHRTLVSRHRVGLVLWAWQLEYESRLRFEDADDAVVEVDARVRGPRASQFEVGTTISGPAGVAVRACAASVPLRLSGDSALSGVPSPLPTSVVDEFLQDERVLAPFRSRVPALQAELEGEGERIGSGTTTFRVHRHHCEVADQWFWAESLGFAAGAREEFVLRHGRTTPELRQCLIGGIRRVDAVWLRSGQLWDLLEVSTTVFHRHDGGTAFVHEFGLADADAGGPLAIVVERT